MFDRAATMQRRCQHALVAALLTAVLGSVLTGCASSTTPGAPSPSPAAVSPPSPPTASPPSPPSGGTSPSTGSAKGKAGRAPSPSGASTADERVASLDGELRASLDEFDEKLLKDQKVQAEQREAAAAGAGLGGSGFEAGSTAAAGAGGAGEGGGAAGLSSAPELDGATREARTPENVGDGHDDDVVARQLREAAQREQNPALREKIWEEYRQYKAATTKSRKEA